MNKLGAYSGLRAFFAFVILLSTVSARAQETSTPIGPKPGEISAEQKEQVIKSLTDVVTQRMFVPGVDFTKWTENLTKHKEAIDKAEDERTFALTLNRALREFGLSHVRLRTPQASQQRRSGPTSTGLGIQAQKEETGGLLVLSVIPKSPAAEAGLEQGDTILEVDGKAPESPAVLSGDAETKVNLKIKKKSGDTLTLDLARKTFSTARQDSLTWQGEDAAVLKVHSFSRGYNREAIEKLANEAAKAKYLVLDLRSNGGGATNNLIHLLSLLLPVDTKVGVFVSRRTMQDYEKANPEGPKDLTSVANWSPRKYTTSKQSVEPFKGKVAVLVNRGSASASEICAAALRGARHWGQNRGRGIGFDLRPSRSGLGAAVSGDRLRHHQRRPPRGQPLAAGSRNNHQSGSRRRSRPRQGPRTASLGCR
jgi:carboxyl-terminal processing protease